MDGVTITDISIDMNKKILSPIEIINRGRKYEAGFNHYDEGWDAFVDGQPFVSASVSWRDGWKDASESNATDRMN